ncbi:MAG: hypothetical protein U0O22_02885 [Acutalibacteraceae bacterium]
MKSKAVVSAITSFFSVVLTYFLLQFLKIENAVLISILIGFLFFNILFEFLIIYGKIMDKKYEEFEKAIKYPVFYKTNGNFDLGGGKIKNANIYFCEKGIVCISLDEKPYTLTEILLQDIQKYQFDHCHLNIFTNNGELFVITLPNVKKVMEILKEKHWADF